MTNFIMLVNIVKRQRQSGTKIPIFSSEFLANSGLSGTNCQVAHSPIGIKRFIDSRPPQGRKTPLEGPPTAADRSMALIPLPGVDRTIQGKWIGLSPQRPLPLRPDVLPQIGAERPVAAANASGGGRGRSG